MITINYLKAQVKAGADTVQVFDSWAGTLSPEDFKTFAQPYLFQIADALKNDASGDFISQRKLVCVKRSK